MSDPAASVDELLREREARGLAVAVSARLIFCGLVGVVAVSQHFAGGFTARSDIEALGTVVLLAPPISVATWALLQARHRRRLRSTGVVLVCLDILVLCLAPVVWFNSAGGGQTSPVFLLKDELNAIAAVLIALNALALRAVYPALVTAAAVLVYGVVSIWVAGDSSTTYTNDLVEHFVSSRVFWPNVVARVVMLALLGSFVTLLTHTARRTARAAAELEHERRALQEKQAELILEGRMMAVNNLVAGVSHELNTPLGVVQSSFDAAQRSGERTQELVHDAESIEGLRQGRLPRVLKALGSSVATGKEAASRISSHVQSLQRFVSLDEADVGELDVRDGLNETVALLAPELLRSNSGRAPFRQRPSSALSPSGDQSSLHDPHRQRLRSHARRRMPLPLDVNFRQQCRSRDP